MHYRRWQRHGDALTNNRPEQVIGTLEERFWAKVDRTGNCWTWNGWRLPAGYGHFRDADKTWLSHRLAYTLTYGAIPTGMEIHHRCVNPSCVRPEHLELVTHAQNLHYSPVAQFKRNAEKTHCKHGHVFDEANTRIRQKGDGRTQRVCKTCEAQAWQRHYDHLLSPDMSQ